MKIIGMNRLLINTVRNNPVSINSFWISYYKDEGLEVAMDIDPLVIVLEL